MGVPVCCQSFLVTEQTMAVRPVRAKRKIKTARIPYRVRQDRELPGRLRPVLAVVYLIYTAGLTSPGEPGLCPEAIRLARILATLKPDEPEVAGLLALLLLTESRRHPGPRQVHRRSTKGQSLRRGPLQNRLARHPER
jgi:RNA polymerase sigma-70 factor (ECF subfamily)